jgi:hypothetical protein
MRSAVLVLAVAPVLSAAQPLPAAPLRVSAIEETGGTVVGRVCRDLDGDGRCSEGEPGIAGARLLLDGGQVAVSDQEGRFHFLEVPGRVLLPSRSGYGGHVVALEGPWGGERVRRYFELPPGGAAHVDLALSVEPDRPPPRLGPGVPPQPFAPRREQEVLVWALGGRAPAGSRVAVDGGEARVTAEGDYAAEVRLRSHRNVFALAVTEPDGRLSLYLQEVHLVPRREGGDAVVPYPPDRLATVELPPPGAAARGLDLLVRGNLAAGASLRITGVAVEPEPGGAFSLRLPLRTGETTLTIEASRGGAIASAAPLVRFERRAGAVVGLADVELSLPGKNRFFTGRGALAVRGTYDEIEGEAGIDLDDRDRSLDALLHPRDPAAVEHQLLPEYSFPTAGDRAAADDPNAARGRVYAKITAPGERLDLGAMRPGFTGHELGRYDRSLYGGKLSAGGALGPLRLEGTVFGSSLRADPGQAAPPRPAHEELAATGGSLFYLRNVEVVVGSEALRVEWRDAMTGLVVQQRTLVRTVDYEIDYVAGRVLLARPLSSVSGPPAIATGDPFSAPEATLFVDYSFSATDGYDDARGARGSLGAGPLRLEAAAASEDRPGGAYSLGTAAAELSFGALLSIRAEAARSHGSAFDRSGDSAFARSIDGGLSFVAPQAPTAGDHDAFHLEARGEAAGATYGAWWRERPRGYSDSSHLETVNSFERGASAAYSGAGNQLSAAYAERRGADPRDPAGIATFGARVGRGRAGRRFGDLQLLAEVIDTSVDTVSQTGLQVSGSQLSAGLRADVRVRSWLSLDASHHQSLARDGGGPAAVDATFSAVGATLSARDSTLSAQGGWGPALGPRVIVAGEQREPGEVVYGTFSMDPDAPSVFRESVSAMGVRRREGSTEIFTEDQFARDPFGLRASRVAGLAIEPLAGFRLSVNAESGSRLRLDDTMVDRRAAGATASLVRGPLRLAARGELREEGSDHQAVAGGAAEWIATDRITLAGRGSWSNGIAAGQRVYFADASIGGAFRSNAWSLLAKLAGIAELRPASVRRDTGLASLALTVDLGTRLALGIGANLGLTRLAGAKEDLVAGSARAMYRIAGPLDVAVEYARRQGLNGTDPGWLAAARAEAGCALGQGRIALGYNLFGFSGSGVDPADEDNKGRVYLRAELVY